METTQETAEVVGVVSGNMFAIRPKQKKILVRLANVRLPKSKREADKAKETLEDLLEGQTVAIDTVVRSRDGGKIAQVTTSDGEFVNQAMRQAIKRMQLEHT